MLLFNGSTEGGVGVTRLQTGGFTVGVLVRIGELVGDLEAGDAVEGALVIGFQVGVATVGLEVGIKDVGF